MSIVNLYPIKFQPRYKMFEHEGKYYIVDVEKGLLTFLFPVFNPLFGKRVYCISEQDYVSLKSETLSTKEIKKIVSPPFYIIMGVTVLVRLLPDDFGTISFVWNQLVYLFILLAVFSIRIFCWRKSSTMKSFLTRPVRKVTLRCRDASGLKENLLSLVMLMCFIGFSRNILFGSDYNLLYHFLSGLTLLGYFIFSLGYYTKSEYEIDM